jgi:copper chaperone
MTTPSRSEPTTTEPTTTEPATTELTTTEPTTAVGGTTYRVSGLTCGHCVSAVIEELSALDGVSAVTVDLSAGGVSTVNVVGAQELTDGQVAAALDEAGNYRLVDTAG